MTLSAQMLLEKATLETSSLAAVGQTSNVGSAPLTIEQVDRFLRLAITPQAMLPDVRMVKSAATKWQESKIDFADRILRPGVEAQALTTGNQVVPSTGVTEISTVLLRGHVPISDEVFEDQVERAGFGDTVMTMMSMGVGRDLEDLMINGDTGSADPLLATLNGWLKKAQGTGGNVLDMTATGQDYQKMFRQLLSSLPAKYKRDPDNMRYYVPVTLMEKYREFLAARGTPGGDMWISSTGDLRFQGILIKAVPLFGVVTGTGANPDTSDILLTHRNNLIYGVHRDVRMETWRDPREGFTSFIVTCRVDAEISHVPATAIATNVDITS